MQKLTKILLKNKLEAKLITGTVIKALINSSDKSRYALINKAIKHNELIVISRSKYILNPDLFNTSFSKFYIANQIHPSSYISLESALAYHSWIPESVPEINSVISGHRKKEYSNKIGDFRYSPVPIYEPNFYDLVKRKDVDSQKFLMADPARALTDMVYLKKIKYTNLDLLTIGYRVDIEHLKNPDLIKDLEHLQNLYKSTYVKNSVKALLKDLKNV